MKLLLFEDSALKPNVESRGIVELVDDDWCRKEMKEPCGHRSSAATPGSVRPSIHSRNAPPAVETKVKSCVTPA